MYNRSSFGGGIDTRSAIFALMVVNAVLLLLSNVFGSVFTEQLGLFYFGGEYFKVPQVITHMFMHGGLVHLASNLFSLFIFGQRLERVWGPQRFILFYVFTGIGGAVLYSAVHAFQVYNIAGTLFPSDAIIETSYTLQYICSVPMVGASGAVFGIIVGAAMLFPNSDAYPGIPIPLKYFAVLYIIWELYRGIAPVPNDYIAHFAHLGGALFGYILIKIWNKDRNSLY